MSGGLWQESLTSEEGWHESLASGVGVAGARPAGLDAGVWLWACSPGNHPCHVLWPVTGMNAFPLWWKVPSWGSGWPRKGEPRVPASRAHQENDICK